jgi:ABC-2 type transport system ATP-binding protein
MAGLIEARGLMKHYGDVVALDGLDLTVPEGTVLGLLGPNGAGKTTAVRILTTLLEPDEGSVEVAGIDVRAHPQEVRRRIGLSGQYAAVDEHLTGFENLDMIGRLYRLPRRDARTRARELLDRFDLAEAADRPVKTYSGGMRRRLDLAGALVAEPPVLFLDEPTTGLDPRSRTNMWDVIRELLSHGTTLLLTTQYLEEADQLADDIVVIDHGRSIAHGTADELKAEVGGERIELVVESVGDVATARRVLDGLAVGEVVVDEHAHTLAAPVSGGARSLMAALRELDAGGVEVLDVGLRRPTLDDVFLALTGHVAEPEPASKDDDARPEPSDAQPPADRPHEDVEVGR